MRYSRLLVFGTALLGGSCAEPGASVALPGAQQEPTTSGAFFLAAVEHLAREASGKLLVDPRPLRPGAHLAAVQAEDLLADAGASTRARADALRERGIAQTDATVDQRCTFSHGMRDAEQFGARVPDSMRAVTAACSAREPYTTLILSLPGRVTESGYPPGTWHVEAVAMHQYGFSIWDLYLYAPRAGQWEVFASKQRFEIWS